MLPAGFLAVAAIISANFHTICRRLFSNSARHDDRMEKLSRKSLLVSLCGREFRRYFASGVYVNNILIYSCIVWNFER